MTALMKICPTCGTEYPDSERFCPQDGAALRTQGGANLVGSIVAERYHVLRKLGAGGMGTVYLAEHVKMGRKSAVKVMNPGMGHDADAITRFNREASNASRINHPNVAGIYDFGETSDGLIYLAMEYVEGEPLTSLIDATGALPPLRAAQITRQAADALAAAHDLGIVHRDLKPDNIMLAKNRDGSDCVKVVDFGIAKAANSDAQKVTRTGLVVGTPAYMSPEQLAGDALDGRSDVYSLALVSFNMLTGKLPFPSETAQEAMIMRLTDRPRTLAEMKPDTAWTPEVQEVMDRALAREVGARYQTANELGQALWDAVRAMPASAEGDAGTLVMAAPTTTVPKTRLAAAELPPKPVKARSRAPIMAGGGLAAVLLLGGALYASRREDAPAAAQKPAVVASRPSTDSVPAAPTVTPVQQSAKPAPEPAHTQVSYRTELGAIDRRAESESTARQALDEANALSTKLTSQDDRVYLAIIRAQAYGTLGQDARACQELREIRAVARSSTHASAVEKSLANCP